MWLFFCRLSSALKKVTHLVGYVRGMMVPIRRSEEESLNACDRVQDLLSQPLKRLPYCWLAIEDSEYDAINTLWSRSGCSTSKTWMNQEEVYSNDGKTSHWSKNAQRASELSKIWDLQSVLSEHILCCPQVDEESLLIISKRYGAMKPSYSSLLLIDNPFQPSTWTLQVTSPHKQGSGK